MTTTNLNDPNELALLIEEVANLISGGYELTDIAERLGLRMVEVREVIEHPAFKPVLDKLDPEAGGNLRSEELDVTAREVLDFVNSRMMDYVKRYDELAMNSKNEAVAKSALDKLTELTTLKSQAAQRETIELTEEDRNRFKETILELHEALKG